jgi:hypothetical protein
MTPSSGQRTEWTRVIDKIAVLLKQGIQLSPEVMAFIDSTLAPSGPDELATLLKHGQSDEAASVLDLLFFPDEAFQRQLEPLLQRYPVSPADFDCFVEHLGRCKLSAHFVLPDGRGRLDLDMPASVLATFVSRLNPTRRLPVRLIEIVQQTVSPQKTDHIQVMLRNYRKALTAEQVQFLGAFFTKMSATGEPLIEHLAVILQVFDETARQISAYQALTEKKRTLISHLRHALKYEQRRRHHAMETLMLGGERMAHIHPEDTLRTIRCIDAVTLAVWGTVGDGGVEPSWQDFGSWDPDDDLASLIRRLDPKRFPG